MFTKVNTAVAAAFLTLAAAPQLASAQTFFSFYPAPQGNRSQPVNQVPSDARASISKVKHHHVYIPRDVRGSVVPYGATEGGPYTPTAQTPPYGLSRDFQDGSRG